MPIAQKHEETPSVAKIHIAPPSLSVTDVVSLTPSSIPFFSFHPRTGVWFQQKQELSSDYDSLYPAGAYSHHHQTNLSRSQPQISPARPLINPTYHVNIRSDTPLEAILPLQITFSRRDPHKRWCIIFKRMVYCERYLNTITIIYFHDPSH